MLKEELIAKSPVRILENGIEGGLQKGNIGLISSKKGIGKTSVLVQLALDKLLQGEQVIHVSFTAHTNYVFAWYENILSELARGKQVEDIETIKEELVINRVVMNFSQDGIEMSRILQSLRAMIVEGEFKATSLIIDGYNFAKAKAMDIDRVEQFAKELNLEIWFSANFEQEELPAAAQEKDPLAVFPKELKDYIKYLSVVIMLEPSDDFIHFKVIKDHGRINPHDLRIKLDSKTLLIAEV